MLRRLIQAAAFVWVACLAAGGYFALRAMIWHYESEAAAATLAGMSVAAVVCGVIALAYVVIGASVFRWISRQIDWMSVELGMIVGGALYAMYSVTANPVGTAIDPGQRALQGAMDGLIMGAGIGLVSYIAVGRRVRLTPAGLIEYVTIFLILLCALQLAQWVETWLQVPDYTAGMLVLLPLAGLIRLALYLPTRRKIKAKRQDDPPPEPETYTEPPYSDYSDTGYDAEITAETD